MYYLFTDPDVKSAVIKMAKEITAKTVAAI